MADSPPASDLEFLGKLREAVEKYFAAVDAWEATYRKYYRMPDAAKPSEDLAAEQREFEYRRRKLSQLLPRARGLCFKCGQPDVFPGLMHTSLGQFAPQNRLDSAIGPNERGAVMACLIELNVACRAAEEGVDIGRKPSLLERILGSLF